MPNRSKTKSRRIGSTRRARGIVFISIPGLPEFRDGDDVAKIIAINAKRSHIAFRDGDVLVLAQKIISKAEGRLVNLAGISASPQARTLAAKLKKDPRLVEVVLGESRRIVRDSPVLIVETHHGFVCANAGVDQSNVPGEENVSLLPRNPDGSALRLAANFRKLTRKRLGVIISDTFGRPWRLGLTNVAIGAAGVPALVDLRGKRDLQGKLLHATVIAVADELASAAGLLMGKADGTPAVIIRNYRFRPSPARAAQIIRPADEDLFR